MNAIRITMAAAGLALAAVSLAANESLDVWKQMYREANSDAQRRSVMFKIMEQHDKQFAPMLLEALDDLYYRRIESGGATEASAKIDLCRLLIRELGNLHAAEAIPRVYAIYDEAKDPMLRYECSVALGSLRANDYAFKLIRDLSDLNLSPESRNPRPKETQAFGLVQGLDALRLPQSYEVLFMASAGWYSNVSRVKDVARQALAKITDDPSDKLAPIIVSNDSLAVKQLALDTENAAAKAPPEKKAAVARVALRLGLDLSPKGNDQAARLARLRKTALSMLVATQDRSPESVPLYVELIRRDTNDDASYDETLQSYALLGHNATDDAARFLVDRLEYFNDRQRKDINTPRDKIMIREIVAAMKRAKNPLTKVVLFKTFNLDVHDAIIIKEAKEAYAQFGNQ